MYYLGYIFIFLLLKYLLIPKYIPNLHNILQQIGGFASYLPQPKKYCSLQLLSIALNLDILLLRYSWKFTSKDSFHFYNKSIIRYYFSIFITSNCSNRYIHSCS